MADDISPMVRLAMSLATAAAVPPAAICEFNAWLLASSRETVATRLETVLATSKNSIDWRRSTGGSVLQAQGRRNSCTCVCLKCRRSQGAVASGRGREEGEGVPKEEEEWNLERF